MIDTPDPAPGGDSLPPRDERGMNTAEYAVGTVAACGFAGLLFLCQDWVQDLLRQFVQLGLQEVQSWRPSGW